MIASGKTTFAIDGVPTAGKSALRAQLATACDGSEVELDRYLVPKQDKYVDALKIPDLMTALDAAARPTFISGVCVLRVLEVLGRKAEVHIYVKRMAKWGWPDADEVTEHARYSDPLSPLGEEVRQYHLVYMPQERADLIYERSPYV
jgi:hypothetical protein